jgi:leucyl/phenylalanyl-tRNA--protein transferase
MSRYASDPFRLTPELLLRAYAAGIFPMAESRSARHVFWIDPKVRGILPLDAVHVPRRLRKTIRRRPFEIRCDTTFATVVQGCARRAPGRRDTWINDEIIRAYTELHELGFAHSLECWREGKLVGGLYGVSLGAAFFGESMFSREKDASKIALVHLVARLRLGGFVLLDVQFVTDHLARFGTIEISARDYHDRLEEALKLRASFYSELGSEEEGSALEELFRQSSTQTS